MKEETMKSLRMLASLMLALLLAFSTTPATSSISADSQHQPQHEPKKEKDSKEEKDSSKKEKDSKKDKDKVDKAIDDLDKALDADKEKGSKKDKNDSKKEKDSKSDKDDYKPSGNEDYEGTYRGESGFHSTGSGRSPGYEIALKIEKAKKGALYTVEGAIKYTPSSEDFSDPELYSVQGSFSPKTGRLRATFKPKSENAEGKGDVDGEYKDGSFAVTLGGIVRFKEVTKQ